MNINSSGEEACPFCGCAYDEMRTTPGCLMPGALIAGGRYVVGGVMAHDDAQAVYVGFDNTTNRRVSIAEILPERLVYRQEDNEHIAPYSQEAANAIGSAIMLLNDDAQKLGAMRSMDGYAHVIDAVAENGTAYLISEHIDGCSLEDMLLSRGGRISFGEALEMMKPIFSAVDIINGQGITHCAIAPDSIRVTNMGKLKLTGCGEAARFACASESAAGADGKSAYRPREYFNRGEAVNASTDVYGLAATIYRMITGRAPRRQSGGEIAAPSRLGVRMMKNAENALMNALEADKSRRPATARELFLMLSGERESAARAVSSGARRISTAAIAAIAAAGVALIAVIAMLAAGVFTAKPTHIEPDSTVSVVIPDFAGGVGMTRKEAINAAKEAGVNIEFVEEYSETAKKGQIFSQSPEAGTKAKQGDVVTLTVSLGAQPTPRPTLTSAPTATPIDTPKPTGTQAPAATPTPTSTAKPGAGEYTIIIDAPRIMIDGEKSRITARVQRNGGSGSSSPKIGDIQWSLKETGLRFIGSHSGSMECTVQACNQGDDTITFSAVIDGKRYTESASVVIKAAQATPTVTPTATPTAINPRIYITGVPSMMEVGESFTARVEIDTDGGRLEKIRWGCSGNNMEGWIVGDYSCSFRALEEGEAVVGVEAMINGNWYSEYEYIQIVASASPTPNSLAAERQNESTEVEVW